MAAPTIRQSNGGTSTSSFPAPATFSVTLPSTAISGNLLVLCFAGDKNTGGLIMDGTGWNVGNVNSIQLNSSSTTLCIAWKESNGTESVISGSTEQLGSGGAGNTFFAMELEQAGSSAWDLLARATRADDGSSVSSVPIGPTSPASPQDGLAIATCSIDSTDGASSPSWTNSFIHRHASPTGGAPGAGGGSGGVFVASRDCLSGNTVSTTLSTGLPADQMNGAIAVFGRTTPPAPVLPVVDAGADATITLGSTFTRTAIEDDGNDTIVNRGWEIISGPDGVGVTDADQTFSYTPNVVGTYIIRYFATNSIGTDSDDVTLFVENASGGGGGNIAVRATSTGLSSSGTTNHSINMPAGILANDVIIVAFTHDHATNVASVGSGTGWTNANRQQEGSTTNLGGNIFWKRSDGNDSLTITTTEAQEASWIVVVVQDATGDLLVAGTSSGISGTPVVDPPALVVSNGDYLGLVFIGIDANPPTNQTITPPTGWINLAESEPTSAGSSAGTYALRSDGVLLGVSTIDPGPTSFTNDEQTISFTVALAQGTVTPTVTNGEVLNIKQASGGNHFGVDVAEAGAAQRVLYETSQIEAGLNIDPEFTPSPDDQWAQFSTRVDAPTTSGSSYARSELREQAPNSDTNLGWDPYDGQEHWIRGRLKFVQLPEDKPEICGFQLHSSADDVIQVRTEDVSGVTKLTLRVNGTSSGIPRPAELYTENDEFDCLLEILPPVAGQTAKCRVYYQNFIVPHYTFPITEMPVGSAYYWKTGNYLQSNETTESDPTVYGTTHLRNLQHWHTGWTTPENYFGLATPSAGTDAGGNVGVEFTRTGTPGGTGLSDRGWAAIDGPVGAPEVGTLLSATDDLTWTPSTEGTYRLRYGVQNGAGWAYDDVIITVAGSTVPTVDAGLDTATDQHNQFIRTATEDDGGAPITSRTWTVVSGPAQVSETLSTSATLTWTPRTGGSYTLRYSATNDIGTSSDDVIITVNTLIYPITASLPLAATTLGTKHIEHVYNPTLILSAPFEGNRTHTFAPSTQFQLLASASGLRVNFVSATFRILAEVTDVARPGQGSVTARMRLTTALSGREHHTLNAQAVSTPLLLVADSTATSTRVDTPVSATAFHLVGSALGTKNVPGSVTGTLPFQALATNVLHETDVSTLADLNLIANTQNNTRDTPAVSVSSLFRLLTDISTSSVRFNNNINTTLLMLRMRVFGQRIIEEIVGRVVPRADNTTQYELLCVARMPQTASSPVLFPVDPIDWTDITHTEELSGVPTLSASAKISTLTEPVLQRLRKLAELPTELWLYRNGKHVFAGPLLGWNVNDESISLEAHGLMAYLRMMYVVSDLKYTNTEQFQIVAGLINQWQVQDYGNFGIDTANIPPSGITRTITYNYVELHNIAQRINDLTKMANGFDISIDPGSRHLQLDHPVRGVDRSVGEDAIIFDQRNVTSHNVVSSAAPGDLASEGFGTGTTEGAEEALISHLSNVELRTRYGRTGIAATFGQINDQATLDSYVQALIDARSTSLMIPGPNTRVTVDSDISAYDVGDTVDYSLHSQLGVSGAFRIRKRSVSVSEEGTESVSIEFV